ncbi:glycosyltransferase [Dactylosporangium vinaceum]|uniref:Glycosyltransferase n=1 Tax=Dactylosporangium vinaceum TaxID=53362 RepID=A0ABV5MIK5_9ACTN|nr:glycosyltransferase [Dactylosporangium vinaceum]UAB97609.1 glycosyltransferase [Dactylosporangium vinaceum]
MNVAAASPGLNVLHVAQPTTGGVARVVISLVRTQMSAGWPVVVACPPGELADLVSAGGGSWMRWDSTRQPGSSLLGEIRALRRIVAACRPDLVHLHSSKAGLIGRLCLRRQLPTVFQPHAWSFAAVGGPLSVMASGWERLAVRWSDLTLYCSRAEQADGQRAGVAGPGRVVLNGVDLASFPAPTEHERAAARAAFGLDDRAPVAVVVGRGCRQKGQDVAIAAWPRVRRHFPDALLLLAGSDVDPLHDPDAGVLALGPRRDVRQVFVAADLVLSPSRWEGLSLALLEGMACARATVATEVAGSREALLGPAANLSAGGALIPPDDVDALAGAVLTRFRHRDLLAAEGDAARRRVEERFTEPGTARSINDAYRMVLHDIGR